jgi:hypothetical protein
MDDAFMFRRRTQNVYSNDHLAATKPSNTVSMASLKNKNPAAFQSFEDL